MVRSKHWRTFQMNDDANISGAARFHMLSHRSAADLQRLQELNAANEAELRKLETAGAR
jgi:hypothetical protein